MKTKSILLNWQANIALITAILAIHPFAASAAESADAKLSSFFQSYLDARFKLQPSDATRLGDHRFDNQLDDLSPAARKGWVTFTKQTLKDLPKQVDYKSLTRAGQVDFEILRQDLETQLWLAENTKPFEEDPRTFGGYISDSVYVLLTQSTLPKETNIRNAIARMAEIPRIISTAKTTLTRPPKPILETAIRQNRGAISFYESEIFQLAGETPQLEALKSAAAKIVPLLNDYQKFLEGELSARATGDWRLGKRKFAKKLELVLDAGMTADQVLADAEAEYAAVHRDLSMISFLLWSQYFPKQPLPRDDSPEGRRAIIAKIIAAVSQEHGKPEELLANTQATVNRIKTFIRERDILRLPEPDLCQIIEMPEFRRGNSIAYLDNAPPLDAKAASYYAVSPPPADWGADKVKSFLEEYNEHMLQILTIHEAYPGHYVQLEYANRNPSLIRRVLSSGVYIEGWAVYTEQTMLDQGYGDRDLRLRLMQLKFYLRAVVNTILDHKMHCQNMTDDEAMKLMVEGAFQSEGEARLKVIRAKQSSTQLSTYFVGRMAHYRLRQAVQRKLGEQFNLGRFHEAVLNEGSIPVKYLPELVPARLQQSR